MNLRAELFFAFSSGHMRVCDRICDEAREQISEGRRLFAELLADTERRIDDIDRQIHACAYCDDGVLQRWSACKSSGRCWHRFENAVATQELRLYATALGRGLNISPRQFIDDFQSTRYRGRA